MAPKKRERGEDISPEVTFSKPKLEKNNWKSYYPPESGEIDLAQYDLPAHGCALEWWYYNCHLTSKTGERFSLFASYFRSISERDDKNAPITPEDYRGAILWSLIDVDKEAYYPDALLDSTSCADMVARLERTRATRKLEHVETPLLEWVQQGRMPLPQRSTKTRVKFPADRCYIEADDCTLEKVPTTKNDTQHASAPKIKYVLKLTNPYLETSANLEFIPQMMPLRHGTTGVVNDLFYYYVPRCVVKGNITVNGVVHEVEGSGWYDREFGAEPTESSERDAMDAWTWFALQFNDNTEFTLFNIVDKDTHLEKEKVGIFSGGNGSQRLSTTDIQLTFSNLWTSLNTFVEYPMEWRLVVPSIQLDVQIQCSFQHQEFLTMLVTGGGFYEGRVTVNGSRAGKAISGVGFLERKNHTTYTNTKGLMKNVGRLVNKIVCDCYPTNASQEYINKMVIGRHCPPGGAGINPKIVSDTMFKPVRALTDRGGKAWRSLVRVSFMNAMAKGHVDTTKYMFFPELLHVGSLIIDDIQDESVLRRGGKCAHLEFGTALAINAGTGCYFMAPLLAGLDDFPAPKAAMLYKLYMDLMRSGHAGQGLDIHGLHYLMPHAVETGQVKDLYDSLKAIHILKTGGAAGTMCAMGAVIMDQPKETMEIVEYFGTQLGLAFQIVDDALNLRGFEGDLKEVGEDIREGKITYPVIKALGRLDKTDRTYLWTVLQEKTTDPGKIASVIAKLDSVAAIDDCLTEASNLVEEAWERVDKVLPDTHAKLLVRTFCGYLTERST